MTKNTESHTTQLPLVSVITPVYNAAKFLPRVVACVQKQVGVSVEHILVDDCSSDNSLGVLRQLADGDARIRIVALPRNGGPVIARNAAIKVAKGKYLAFLDADDLWLPDKCLVQTEFMERSGAVLSFTDYRFISEDGSLIGRRLRGPSQVGWAMHHMTRYLGCLTIVLDRTKYPEFCFPDIRPATRAEDFLAWSQCIQRFGPALRCPHDLARYAVVANSRSAAKKGAISVWRLYRNLEQIPFHHTMFYFVIYAAGVFWKRYWYQPSIDRMAVDHDCQWYLLDDSDSRKGV